MLNSFSLLSEHRIRQCVGSTSTALSSPVFVPPRERRSAGSFPEQRLVIEPTSGRIAQEPSVYTNYTFGVTKNKVRTFRKRLGPMRVRRWAAVRVYDDPGRTPV